MRSDSIARTPSVRRLLLPLLALVSLALPLLALEALLALRARGDTALDHWKTRGYYGPDPDLIFFPKANVHNVWATDEFVEEVQTNSLGLRDREIGDRADFERRIVIVGDSMTFGHGVAAEEAYPSVLEALYRETGRRVDVVNAGVKGFGIDQSYKLFQTRLRPLDPDLVILAYYANDLKDGILHPLYRLAGGRLVPLDARDDPIYVIGRVNELLPGFLRDSYSLRWITSRLIRSTSRKLEGDLTPRQRFRIEQRKISLQVEHLVRTGRDDGFELVVLALPYRDPTLAARYGWLGSLARRAHLLDLSGDPEWQLRRGELFFRTDFHLSAAGHARVGERLFDYLDREGL
jgi:lysophospholipase L1-like esterase